jgi:hypothetical protein
MGSSTHPVLSLHVPGAKVVSSTVPLLNGKLAALEAYFPIDVISVTVISLLSSFLLVLSLSILSSLM